MQRMCSTHTANAVRVELQAAPGVQRVNRVIGATKLKISWILTLVCASASVCEVSARRAAEHSSVCVCVCAC